MAEQAGSLTSVATQQDLGSQWNLLIERASQLRSEGHICHGDIQSAENTQLCTKQPPSGEQSRLIQQASEVSSREENKWCDICIRCCMYCGDMLNVVLVFFMMCCE
ncbi:hypothetical protein JTB14_021737 [Gonioctena quinquepunctata]|nr:hypothetical protein JTB14_021737 [Gonioctena quinquepunctata]